MLPSCGDLLKRLQGTTLVPSTCIKREGEYLKLQGFYLIKYGLFFLTLVLSAQLKGGAAL